MTKKRNPGGEAGARSREAIKVEVPLLNTAPREQQGKFSAAGRLPGMPDVAALDIAALARAERPTKALANEICRWLCTLPQPAVTVCCPVPQWAGVKPHAVRAKHDLHRGLVIRCEGGHRPKEVLAAWLRPDQQKDGAPVAATTDMPVIARVVTATIVPVDTISDKPVIAPVDTKTEAATIVPVVTATARRQGKRKPTREEIDEQYRRAAIVDCLVQLRECGPPAERQQVLARLHALGCPDYASAERLVNRKTKSRRQD